MRIIRMSMGEQMKDIINNWEIRIGEWRFRLPDPLAIGLLIIIMMHECPK